MVGRDDELHMLIGKLVVRWAHIEQRLDATRRLLDEYDALTHREKASDEQAKLGSSSRQFERVRSDWAKRLRRIDLTGGQYGSDTKSIARELKHHRHLRDILVHGAPDLDDWIPEQVVKVRMSSAARSAFFQSSVDIKRRELIRNGANPRSLKHGLREFMAEVGEILVPIEDIRRSSDRIRILYVELNDVWLDLNRLISAERSKLLAAKRNG